MANAWVHSVIDLISYGRPYFDIHKKKDKSSEYLGRKHRVLNHKWYNNFGKLWDFNEPFPTLIKKSIQKLGNEKGVLKAEKGMAWTDHDYIDRIWDGLSDKQIKYWEGFFAWILFNPDILKSWAGVDVLNGKIKRLIKNSEVWEICPELKSEYKRLCNYVGKFN